MSANRQTVAFGRALHDSRTARKLSQNELASKAGVTQAAVSGWESGTYVPEPAVVFKLERTLRVPPGYLSVHLGYVPADAQTTVTGDVERAVLGSPVLDSHDKRALVAMFRQLARRPRRRV